MNADNQSLAAAAELDRAVRCLEEARMLRAGLLPYGAVARAYYAVFHAARALLFSLGLEVTSHRAVVSLVGEHFGKTGMLDPGLTRLLARMQRDREDADYDTGAIFTDEMAEESLVSAERFLIAAKNLLT